MIHHIQNRDDLQKQLVEAGDKLVVIDFFATWCGPCKIIAPKLEELSVQYKDQIIVLKADVDECEDVVLMYNVISMPTFIFFKNQAVIDMFVGGNSERLVKTVEKYLGGGGQQMGGPNLGANYPTMNVGVMPEEAVGGLVYTTAQGTPDTVPISDDTQYVEY